MTLRYGIIFFIFLIFYVEAPIEAPNKFIGPLNSDLATSSATVETNEPLQFRKLFFARWLSSFAPDANRTANHLERSCRYVGQSSCYD